ncbi:transmembrane protein, putative [Rhizoctonia solani AG-3 Rhs1AP]|uniref:Transmembrane protein, putative n=1 Tax=Rhizoctonia solani AG-3 Rhs1AP TaxID=1086054 RepID=X8JGW3_9AGAM|nr:transmembrane protein, putative [Rhizoctonia solani AG-3 Rhs1AP]
MEYAYTHAPPSTKTIVSAMNVAPNAGSALPVYALLYFL